MLSCGWQVGEECNWNRASLSSMEGQRKREQGLAEEVGRKQVLQGAWYCVRSLNSLKAGGGGGLKAPSDYSMTHQERKS